jgi:hypothetical protein
MFRTMSEVFQNFSKLIRGFDLGASIAATRHSEVTSMDEWSPLEEDVLLKGMLRVIVRGGRDGIPRAGQQVVIKGCGFL